MSKQTTTTDIGFAIRDFLENRLIDRFDDEAEVIDGAADRVEQVDVSDADNLLFHMESGAVFTVRIVRTA